MQHAIPSSQVVQDQPPPRGILLTLVITGLAAVASMFAIVTWMADATNALAQANSAELIKATLRGMEKRLTISTADYGNWNEAYDWVVAQDSEAILANIGTGATEGKTFDLLFLTQADGSFLYAFANGQTESNPAIFDPHLARTLARSVASMPGTPYDTVAGYANVGGGIAMVSAGRVQPYDLAGLDVARLPVLVTGIDLSPARLMQIGTDLVIRDIRLTQEPAVADGGASSLPLMGVDGTQVATLTWTPAKPGTVLFWRSMPIVACMSILLMACSTIVGRASIQQTANYVRAKQQGQTDPLTGLMNRAGVDDLIARPKIRSALSRGAAALIFMDLNGFKLINDRCGHDVGDLALQITAERLRASIRPGDILARIGGDEFVCLLIGDGPAQAAELVAQRIVSRTSGAIHIGDQDHFCRPALGIAVADPGMGWAELLGRADQAMYAAKNRSIDQPVFYSPSVGADASLRKARVTLRSVGSP